MPVDVTRKSSPPLAIVVTDDVGDSLTVTSNHNGFMGGLRAEVHVSGGRDPFIRLSFADARDLAAALIEWADAVEG